MTLLSELQALKSAHKGNADVTGAINDTISIIEKHFSTMLSKRKTTSPVCAMPRPQAEAIEARGAAPASPQE